MIKFLYLIKNTIEIIFYRIPIILISLLALIILYTIFSPYFYVIGIIILIVSLFQKKFFQSLLIIVFSLLFLSFMKYTLYLIVEYSIKSKISITYIAHLFVLHNGFTISLIVLLSAGSLYCINYLLLYILSEEFRIKERQRFHDYEINLSDRIRYNNEHRDSNDYENWIEKRKKREEQDWQDRVEENRLDNIQKQRDWYNEQCAKDQESRDRAEEERRAEEDRAKYNDFWKT